MGYLLTAEEDKSPQWFDFHRFTTRYAARTTATSVQSFRGRLAQVTLDESKNPITDTVCACSGAGFSVSEQVYDLWMNSRQACAT